MGGYSGRDFGHGNQHSEECVSYGIRVLNLFARGYGYDGRLEGHISGAQIRRG